MDEYIKVLLWLLLTQFLPKPVVMLRRVSDMDSDTVRPNEMKESTAMLKRFVQMVSSVWVKGTAVMVVWAGSHGTLNHWVRFLLLLLDISAGLGGQLACHIFARLHCDAARGPICNVR